MLRLLLAAALALAACRPVPVTSTPEPTGALLGGTLRVAIPAEITTLDPWSAEAASLVATRQVFETLVAVDVATSAIVPGLAASWQSTNDGATWTFTLRDAVYLHDGGLLDAATVVASFERGHTTQSYRVLFDDPAAIARVQALDARTVRFDLRAPFGPFLAHLASPHAAVARGLAGTGPFAAAADAVAPDGTATLRRNGSYWKRDAQGRALPYLDAVVLRPVRDPPSRLAELRAGRVDVALDLPTALAAAARSDPSLAVVSRRDAALASVGFDTIASPFDRVEMRRAVAMALDRNAMSAIYAGLSRPAIQLVPPGTLGHDESVVEFAPLDVAAARKAVTDARIPTPVNVDLVYPALPTPAYPDPQRAAQLVAADLSKIGVVARLRAVDPGAVRATRGALTLDTTALGLDPDETFWPLLGPRVDERVDSLAVGLLRRARDEADASKRAELYKQVSKISRAEVLRIPLVFADIPSAASARLVVTAGLGIEYFGTVWLRA